MESFWNELTNELPSALAYWMPRVAAGVIIMVLFWLVARGLSKSISLALERTKLDATLGAFMVNVIRYVVLTIGFITALGQIGVDTTSLLASVGVVGITIGFAAQDTVSNIISGIFLFWDRPFVIGDLVEIDDKYGRVDEISLRTTRVITPDGLMLSIPNRVVANTTVASYTNFPNIRLDIDVTVAVEENIGRIRELLLELVTGDKRFLHGEKHTPVVIVSALNDYNVALQLRVWLDDEMTHVVERNELRERVFEKLRDAGVDMPFETISLNPVEVRQSRLAA